MSYRDDQEAQFARLEAVTRENQKLRDENIQLRRAVAASHLADLDPPWVDPAFTVDEPVVRITRAEIVLAAALTAPVVFGMLYGLSHLW